MVRIKIETKDEPSEQGEKCNSIIVSWDRGEKNSKFKNPKFQIFLYLMPGVRFTNHEFLIAIVSNGSP